MRTDVPRKSMFDLAVLAEAMISAYPETARELIAVALVHDGVLDDELPDATDARVADATDAACNIIGGYGKEYMTTKISDLVAGTVDKPIDPPQQDTGTNEFLTDIGGAK